MLKKAHEKESTLSADMFVRLGTNETVVIMPLCDFEGENGIDKYFEHPFSKGSDFFTLPDTGETNDPCRMIGSKKQVRYIMPVVVWDDASKSWSEPKYYQFKTQIFKAFTSINQALIDDGEGKTFKGAAIRITRVDEKGGGAFGTSYNAQYSPAKKYEVTEIPSHDLDMLRGIIPFAYDSEDEIRGKIIGKLIERGTTTFEGKTILERMREVGLISSENKENDDWSDIKPEPEIEDVPF